MPSTVFLEGPAGTGKTTRAIQYIRDVLESDVPSHRVLVLVPQRALGQAYQRAFAEPAWPGGVQIDVVTLGGLARRGLETFWPLIAEKAGFAQPYQEPSFLTIETTQYYMARFVRAAIKTGVFDSVSMTPFDIMRQTHDNLSKAAINGFPLEQIASRLTAAWGNRHSSRPPVYRAVQDLAQEFRAHCLEHNLLDFSLQIEVFMQYLLDEPLYHQFIRTRYRHLVADNLEESPPVVADFIHWLWPSLDSARLIYDIDGGYRIFLGADPGLMYTLAELCDEHEMLTEAVNTPQPLVALTAELDAMLSPDVPPPDRDGAANPREGFIFSSHKFHPQMVDWVAEQVIALIESGVSPREVVILAPFLSDSLRFSLDNRLQAAGIETVSHRPSRAMRDEPAARAVLTLMALAHPQWGFRPPLLDVADTLRQAIDELDPVRAWLLAQIVYRPSADELGSFDVIQPDMQQRITFRAGAKYEHLRAWLAAYREETETATIPPDQFLSRLFGELLAQPGYGFHTDLDAGRTVAQLVESARKFRRTLYPDGTDDWRAVSREYYELVDEGLLAALYVSSWREEERDAVFLAPAYTFLMRNRWVDYQFWLDLGSNLWWERLEQPLTHPYVLRRGYPANQVWTDEMEFVTRQRALRRLVIGLSRRCRKQIYAAIADLGEQGYEQRGPLLDVVQQITQRYDDPYAEPEVSA